MSIPSSLTAPLLLHRGRRRDATTLNGNNSEKSEEEKNTQVVIRVSSPSAFMHNVLSGITTAVDLPPTVKNHKQNHNTNNTNNTNNSNNSNSNKNASTTSSECEDGESPIITQIKSNPHRILRFTEKWTFAASPFSDDVQNWSVMSTNRLDHVLQTWSQLTTHLVSPHNRHGSAVVSFFPTKLPKCITSAETGCDDSVFYEVRAHIPIHLLFQPLPDSNNDDTTTTPIPTTTTTTNNNSNTDINTDNTTTPASGVVPDTLAEFVSSGCMYARRLRALMHDAVISFMSSASHAAPPTKLWRCSGKMLRETSCVSISGTSPIEDDDDEADEVEKKNNSKEDNENNKDDEEVLLLEEEEEEEDETLLSNARCNCSKMNVKAMHQLLSPSLHALAPPTPIVLSMRIINGSRCGCQDDDITPLPGTTTTTTSKKQKKKVETTMKTTSSLLSSSSSSSSSLASSGRTNTISTETRTENGEIERQDVTLLVHIVVRVARIHAEPQEEEPSQSQSHYHNNNQEKEEEKEDEQPPPQQWDAASIAFEVLTSLFPERFVLHKSMCVSAGALRHSGHTANLSFFNAIELTTARCRLRDARVWLPPALTPSSSLTPSPSLTPSASPAHVMSIMTGMMETPAKTPTKMITTTTTIITTGTTTTTTGTTSTTTSSSGRKAGVRVQHDPYSSVVTWTPTQTGETEEEEEEEEEIITPRRSDGLNSNNNGMTAMMIDKSYEDNEEEEEEEEEEMNRNKGDVNISHDTAQGTSTQATTTPTAREDEEDDAEEVETALHQVEKEQQAEEEEKEEEKEKEEEEELDIQNTKQMILSMCEEIAAARREWTEEQQRLESQLSALLLQSLGMEETTPISISTSSLIGTTTAMRRKKNKSGKHNTNAMTTGSTIGSGSDMEEAVEWICALFGISPTLVESGNINSNNSNSNSGTNATNTNTNNTNNSGSGGALLQQALMRHVMNNPTLNNTYNDMDECVKDAADIIQTLESQLRSKALRVQYINQKGRKPLNGEVAAKNSRKKKNDIPLFATAAKAILQERQRPTGTTLSRKTDDETGKMNPLHLHHYSNSNNSNNNTINMINPNSNLNNSAGSVVLQCTKSGCIEARHCIHAACEKLHTATKWSQHYTTQLQCMRLVCEAVLLPFLHGRTIVEKTEEKERTQLHVEYTVAGAILRESQSLTETIIKEEEEEEEEEENVRGFAKRKKRAAPQSTKTGTNNMNMNMNINRTNDTNEEEEEEEEEENELTDTVENRPLRTETTINTSTISTIGVSKRKGKGGVISTISPARSTAIAESPIETTTATISTSAATNTNNNNNKDNNNNNNNNNNKDNNNNNNNNNTKSRLGGGKKRTGVMVEPKHAILRERDVLQRKTLLLFMVFCLIAVFVFLFL